MGCYNGTITQQIRVSVSVDQSVHSEFNDYTDELGIMYGKKNSKVHINDIEMILHNFTLSNYDVKTTTQFYTPNVKTSDVIKKYNSEHQSDTGYTDFNITADSKCTKSDHSMSTAIKSTGSYILEIYLGNKNTADNPDEIYKFKLYNKAPPTGCDFETLDGYYGVWVA